MSRNMIWEKKVNELKERYARGDGKKVNLVKIFNELDSITLTKDIFAAEFDHLASDLAIIENLIALEKQVLLQSKKISPFSKSKLNIAKDIASKKAYIKKLISFLNSSPKFKRSKKYPYSKLLIYIQRLAGVFHSLTREIPECNQGIDYEDYYGKFYDFLLETKPLLKTIGIDLKKDATIGKYAHKILAGYIDKDGNEISSYKDTLNYFDIDIPSI